MVEKPNWRAIAANYPLFTPEFTIKPDKTALLLIDMQYLDASPDHGIGLLLKEKYPKIYSYFFTRLKEEVIPNQLKLLDFFRKNNLQIVHVTMGAYLPDGRDYSPLRREADKRMERETGKKGIFYHIGTPEFQILEELRPQSQWELVVNKTTRSVFNSSGLDQLLRNMYLDTLIITGVVTNSCVQLATVDGADRAYKCTVVDDAVSTFSKQQDEVFLASFAQLYARVESTDTVINELRANLT